MTPFPFVPVGAVVASFILGVTLTVFIVALKGLDRAATQGGAVVGGLVSGIRTWSAPGQRPERGAANSDATSPADALDLVESSGATPVEPVRRRRG